MTVYGSAIALSLVACVGIAGTEALVRPLSSPYRVIVSPSVAEANYLRLGEDLDAVVRAGAEWLHFPVQDGRMVPHITIGPAVIADCRKAFPNTIFDVKLSCIEPEHLIDEFVKAGADIISVHPEATSQVGAVIDKIQQAGCTPGIILNPGTSVSSVEYVLDQCQVAVVMLVSSTEVARRAWRCFVSNPMNLICLLFLMAYSRRILAMGVRCILIKPFTKSKRFEQ